MLLRFEMYLHPSTLSLTLLEKLSAITNPQHALVLHELNQKFFSIMMASTNTMREKSKPPIGGITLRTRRDRGSES